MNSLICTCSAYLQIKQQPPPGSPTNGVKQLWIACAWDHYQSVSTEMWWMLLLTSAWTTHTLHYHIQLFSLASSFFLYDTVLPSVTSPSCLQTTAASVVSQLSLQTVPHCPPIQTSTLPSCSSPPPVSLMSVSLQDGPKRHTYRNASHMAWTLLSFILPWAYIQCTKQLKMIAEATSFQLTCKIIASLTAVGRALEKNNAS